MSMKQTGKNRAGALEVKSILWPTVTGAIFLIISLIVNNFANLFALKKISNPVTDIVLSNVPVMDVDMIITVIILAVIVFAIYAGVRYHHRVPFILKSIALFFLIRSAFIIMTHLGPFPIQTEVTSNTILRTIGVGYGADFFFSGHTGLPFLLSLIFWDRPKIRYVFLASSISLGALMLLGHLHYSIDVFGAFFMTYTIFHLAKYLFTSDIKIFLNKLKPSFLK